MIRNPVVGSETVSTPPDDIPLVTRSFASDSRYAVPVAFVIFVLTKGFNFPAFEVGLDSVPVLLLSALRFDLAAVVLFAYVFWTGRTWKPTTRGDVIAILAGGLGICFVGTVFWATGQKLTTATLSGLMSSLLPLATAGFSWILLPQDRLSPLGMVGLGVGFFGALLILLPSGALVFSSGLLGKGLIFVGVLIASLSSVSIRWAKPSLPAATQTAWATLLGAMMTHLLSPAMGESFTDVYLNPESIAAILFLGVMSAAIGRMLFYWLLAQRTAIEISLSSYIAPVITAAVGWSAFGDPISVSMVVGFLVVIFGFGLMERDAIRREFGRIRRRRVTTDD